MVVFDVDLSPSLRRCNPSHHHHQGSGDATIDVTSSTGAPDINEAGETSPSSPERSSSGIVTLVTRYNGSSPCHPHGRNNAKSQNTESTTGINTTAVMSLDGPFVPSNTSATRAAAAAVAPDHTSSGTLSFDLLATSSSSEEDGNIAADCTTSSTQNAGSCLHVPQELPVASSSSPSKQNFSINSSKNKKRPKPPRNGGVYFANDNHLATIIDDNPALFTDYEKSICFTSKKDRTLFEQDRLTVYTSYDAHMKHNLTWVETDQITLRGLEDFFGLRSKEEIRRQHVHRVLKEQTRQRQQLPAPSPGTGRQEPLLLAAPRQVEHDADTLRYVSSESSAEGRQRAIAVGKDDEIVAMRVYQHKKMSNSRQTPSDNASNNTINNMPVEGKSPLPGAAEAMQTPFLALPTWEQRWF